MLQHGQPPGQSKHILPCHETPLIHAANISLFAYYRHPAQVIYEVITAFTCMRFQCHLMQLYKYRSTTITKPIRNATTQWHSTVLCWHICKNNELYPAWFLAVATDHTYRQWRTEEGLFGVSTPPPPPKFRRSSKIVPTLTQPWKLLKIAEFRTSTPQDVRKKAVKF